MPRAFILVLDSFGLGSAPDADRFGDRGADTFGHIAAHEALALPHLESLGLAAAAQMASGSWAEGFAMRRGFTGAYGAAFEQSTGKDTPSGHWEIAGVPVAFDWGYFPREQPCFPESFTSALIREAGLPGLLGNCHSSGTEIIARLGDEHVATGKPIVYTSADSVFQVAAHESAFGLERLQELCKLAFKLLAPYRIARVIARPFVGAQGDYRRTANRKDYSQSPPAATLLDHVQDAGGEVIGIGKIGDIFADQGVSRNLKADGNMALFDATLQAADEAGAGSLVFANFVDFDQSFGHRRDVPGYAQALRDFDARLPELMGRMQPDDLAVITADHGCDPTWPGSDHTREYVPMLFFGQSVLPRPLGISDSFADIGQTIARHLAVAPLAHGKCLL